VPARAVVAGGSAVCLLPAHQCTSSASARVVRLLFLGPRAELSWPLSVLPVSRMRRLFKSLTPTQLLGRCPPPPSMLRPERARRGTLLCAEMNGHCCTDTELNVKLRLFSTPYAMTSQRRHRLRYGFGTIVTPRVRQPSRACGPRACKRPAGSRAKQRLTDSQRPAQAHSLITGDSTAVLHRPRVPHHNDWPSRGDFWRSILVGAPELCSRAPNR
jgi:hypothetical protein